VTGIRLINSGSQAPMLVLTTSHSAHSVVHYTYNSSPAPHLARPMFPSPVKERTLLAHPHHGVADCFTQFILYLHRRDRPAANAAQGYRTAQCRPRFPSGCRGIWTMPIFWLLTHDPEIFAPNYIWGVKKLPWKSVSDRPSRSRVLS